MAVLRQRLQEVLKVRDLYFEALQRRDGAQAVEYCLGFVNGALLHTPLTWTRTEVNPTRISTRLDVDIHIPFGLQPCEATSRQVLQWTEDALRELHEGSSISISLQPKMHREWHFTIEVNMDVPKDTPFGFSTVRA